MQKHVITFKRNVKTNQWRAHCVCGWSKLSSDAMFVQVSAYDHDDDDWVLDNPEAYTGYKSEEP